MDFYKVMRRITKDKIIEVYVDFSLSKSKDFMIRGGDFYAIWDEELGLWNTDPYRVVEIINKDISKDVEDFRNDPANNDMSVKPIYVTFGNGVWSKYLAWIRSMPDNYIQLDSDVTFADTVVTKDMYRSKRLPYSLKDGPCPAYTELSTTLYKPRELEKLEWAIGSILTGKSKDIQKFVVLYGDAGSGKSTMLNIIQKLFESYYGLFDAKTLASRSASFALEPFMDNPLVAIQHDGDLSRLEDNTRLNSIVSHEEMLINAKFKSQYSARMDSFLFMATNSPVKITDARSGLIRRLIEVEPSGNKVPANRYQTLVSQIDFELGAIAYHCIKVFESQGSHYYDSYRSTDMIYRTDFFFNFVEDCYFDFKRDDETTLKSAYAKYKEYCQDSGTQYPMKRHAFRDELKNYFREFKNEHRDGFGNHVRSYYKGFKYELFETLNDNESDMDEIVEVVPMLELDCEESIFDQECSECFAQYSTANELPKNRWEKVKTRLKDLDTSKLHYVKVPENHIVIDFDLKDISGEKSLEKNLRAAAKWPSTYSELSKSGKGVHLHYIYDGDANALDRIYDHEGIEVKVFTGNSSLRRKLSKCNNVPIATISSGLPLKGEKVVNFENIKNEKAVRTLVLKNLRKEVHGATKPSVDFIYKILEDAYASGIRYDIRDMRPAVMAFANNSSHQSAACVSLVGKMHFHSEDISESEEELPNGQQYDSDQIVFFDVEVFPNLFIVCWKPYDDSDAVSYLINPKPSELEPLLKMKLVGFNNRRYDNHIMYGAYIGHTNQQLYLLSQRLINGSKNAGFAEAYSLSYTDIYDFSSKKQSLKKFEIELGLYHHENPLPWDQPVNEDCWMDVVGYCQDDVRATQAVFEARQADYIAREILSDISGMPRNATTQQHTARIIFGNDKNAKSKFVYTDLSEEFPGYKFEAGKSTYLGEETGEGGYVYAEPGAYGNVALLDISSMHPHSLIRLNLFGEYTKNFEDIVEARVDIKHRELDSARQRLDGKLIPYLENADEDYLDSLAYALKIAINIVYGMTSAKFDNPFKDPRNVDNIVAKRGALFMINLKHELQTRGCTVAHIKTDSVKIPNASPEDIQFVMEYGEKYGYSFEHEATYDKMCLVNESTYIARYKDGKHAMEWTATAAQFQHPYVFKSLFSKETTDYRDISETKSVSDAAIYMDFNEKELEAGVPEDAAHQYSFVGKVGRFTPVKSGTGGGILLRRSNRNPEKYSAVAGTKGYRWKETTTIDADPQKYKDDIDWTYGQQLLDAAIETISKYCDFEWFTAPEPYDGIPF